MSESSDNPLDLLNAAVTAKAAIAVVATDGSGKSIKGFVSASFFTIGTMPELKAGPVGPGATGGPFCCFD